MALEPLPHVSINTLNRLNTLGKEIDVIVGSCLLDASHIWNKVTLIEAGVVRMFYLAIDGKEHNKNFFFEGDIFWPVTPSLQEKAAGFTIEALSNVKAIQWHIDDFKSAFESELEWLKFTLFWSDKLLDSKMQREQEWLQLPAKARYENLLIKHPDIVQRVPAHHIASFLGITSVTLSRLKHAS